MLFRRRLAVDVSIIYLYYGRVDFPAMGAAVMESLKQLHQDVTPPQYAIRGE